MSWIKTAPTAPGYYWYRYKPDAAAGPVLFDSSGNVTFVGNEQEFSLENLRRDGHEEAQFWADPIEPPPARGKVESAPPIMKPGHPQWDAFISDLEGPNGCNFRAAKRRTVWSCSARSDRPHARRLLAKYGADVERSIEWFSQNGGHCDCEIIFNCVRR